jgi:hypothetical protein
MRSPNLEARAAGACYILTTALGVSAYSIEGKLGDTLNFVAALFYLAVTLLFFRLFKAVNAPLSLGAALFSFAGCGLQILDTFNANPFHVNNIIFFGVYCLLIALLIARSTFLPTWLAIFMALAGFSWLTYLSPHIGRQLSSYTFATGLVGEGALTLWLLIKGIDEAGFRRQQQR